jgi:dipeptidyl aminopeptidase/acylaminoacyl peptidase
MRSVPRSAVSRRRGGRSPLLFCVVLGMAVHLVRPAAQSPPAAMEMRDFFGGKWTYQASWSPNGALIAYLQDNWTRQDLYVVPAAGGQPRRLSQAERFIGNPRGNSAGQPPVWSPDSSEILYGQDGALKIVSVNDGRIRDFAPSEEAKGNASYSPDGKALVYGSRGRLYVAPRESGAPREIQTAGRALGGPLWSPDARRLAFSANTLAQSFTLAPSYVGRLLTFPFSQPGTSDVGVVDLESGQITWIAASPLAESVLAWSPNGRSLLIERVSDDFKERRLLLADVVGGPLDTILEERDEKYLPLGRGFASFLQDGSRIVYASEASGWNHVYTFDTATRRSRALTSGPFDVREIALGPDNAIYFASNEVGPDQPQIYKVAAAGGSPTRLTTERAVHTGLHLEPAGTRILYLRSDARSMPDVFVQRADGSKPALRLTMSNPSGPVVDRWQEPRLVTYPGHDGLTVKAQLFVPPFATPGRLFPAIVHVHQAASYQDVYAGPGPQKDNVTWYGWHQRLAQLGYVVLNVDYRGSTGYGRAYRVANYRDLGGGDRLDAVSGVQYLKTLGVVDTDRVGVYGMSYGGHLVLSLLTKNPTVFRAGVDIAGVADMRMVYETAGRAAVVARLSTPDAAADLYRESSALSFVDRIASPVMVLHGTDDPNVSILQSLRLVDALLAHGKRFEFEVYPGELHFFTRSRSWIDAFGKMERFLFEELAPAASLKR